MPTSNTFTYTVPGRVQQDTGAYVRYLDIPVCVGGATNIYPPGWFACGELNNSQAIGMDASVDRDAGKQSLRPECFACGELNNSQAIGMDASVDRDAGKQSLRPECFAQFFNCSKCAADKPYYQQFDIKNNFIDFQFRIPGNWEKGFATPGSLAGTYDFEVTIWSCARDGSGMFVPTPTVVSKLPTHRQPAFVTTFSGIMPDGTAFQNVRINRQDFFTYQCESEVVVPYGNNQGFITIDVYPQNPASEVIYTIYSQMFDFQCNPCPESQIKIKAQYPITDFWGNIYNTGAVTGIGTNFIFDNTRWWPGELFETAVTSNRALDSNQQTQSVTADKKFRGRVTGGIPQYETENLAINLQGIETFIDDILYNKGTGFEKNQEVGSLWYPTFTVEQNFGYGIDNPVKNCN